MKTLSITILIALLFSCASKPLRYSDLHFLSLPEANEGKSLPVHVVPVNNELMVRITVVKPEEWFVSELVETTPGIQKRVFRGKETNIVRVERIDDKNNFLVVTDFAKNESVEAQRVFIGEKFWRAKEIHLLITRDGVRLIDKETYQNYLTSN